MKLEKLMGDNIISITNIYGVHQLHNDYRFYLHHYHPQRMSNRLQVNKSYTTNKADIPDTMYVGYKLE